MHRVRDVTKWRLHIYRLLVTAQNYSKETDAGSAALFAGYQKPHTVAFRLSLRARTVPTERHRWLERRPVSAVSPLVCMHLASCDGYVFSGE